jgi:hypothetical protein
MMRNSWQFENTLHVREENQQDFLAALQGIDRRIIAGRKHQASTIFLKDYGRAFL